VFRVSALAHPLLALLQLILAYATLGFIELVLLINHGCLARYVTQMLHPLEAVLLEAMKIESRALATLVL
jgi:hypothetical protein